MRAYTFKKMSRITVSCLLVVAMLANLYPLNRASAENNRAMIAAQPVAPISFKDTKDHWAAQEIGEWSRLGLISGFQDGSFRPDGKITRVEFATLVNRLFGFTEQGSIQFSDVIPQAWFAAQVGLAVKAGYMQGYDTGMFHPEQPLTRAEAAVILARLVPLVVETGADPLSGFADRAGVAAFSKEALAGAVADGYLSGYEDGTLRPARSITRAEAIVLLDRVLKQSSGNPGQGFKPAPRVLAQAGTYGPAAGTATVAGDLTLNAPGIAVQNLTVTGDLLIGEAVGEGDVYLRNVKVAGNTIVKGGGQNSIHIDDSDLSTIIVEKVGGRVRVVVGGTTVIEQMDIQSNAIIESNGSGGILGVTISREGEVTLSGSFKNVEVKANVQLTIASGTVESIQVNMEVTDSTITLNESVHVNQMDLHGSSNIKGTGTIDKAKIDNPTQVNFEKAPTSTEVTSGSAPVSPGTPASTSTATPPSTPTETPTKTPTETPTPTPISVGIDASQSARNSFILLLTPAVPGLNAANFTLRDNASPNDKVDTSAASHDGGASYAVTASLIQGHTYTLTIAKTGYSFGSAVAFTVPLPFQVTVSAATYVTAEGFTIPMSPAPSDILGLASFTLKNSAGTTIHITSVTPNIADSSASYAVITNLIEGGTYTLTVEKSGYDFGPAVTITVPMTVTPDVSVGITIAHTTTAGFSIWTDKAIDGGLDDSNIILTENGTPVAITVTSNGGTSPYEVSAALTEGHTYTLTIAKTGYRFETVDLTVPTAVAVSAVTNVSAAGFTISLNQALADNLTASDMTLSDGYSHIPLTIGAPSNGGVDYTVSATLIEGQAYTLTIVKPGYFFAPIDLTVPIAIEISTGANPTTAGFFIVLGKAVAGTLIDTDFTLTDNNTTSATVPILDVAPSNAGLRYDLSATLTEGHTYKLTITKPGYSFQAVRLTVPDTSVANTEITPTISNVASSGFSIQMSGISGVNSSSFILRDTFNQSIIPVDMVLPAGNSTYTVFTQLDEDKQYSLSLDVPGYVFSNANSVPIAVNVDRVNIPVQVDLVSHQGFRLTFATRIDRLDASRISLLDGSGIDVPISSVAAIVDGTSYLVSAYMPGESTAQTYTFKIKWPNNSGASGSFEIASVIDVAMQADAITTTGLTLAFHTPIADLTAGEIVLTKNDADSTAVQVGAVSTADSGSSYAIVTAALESGSMYTLAISGHPAYHFAELIFTVPLPPIYVNKHVDRNGDSSFYAGIDSSISWAPDFDTHFLEVANVKITDMNGVNMPIDSVVWDGGRFIITFTRDTTRDYIVTLTKPGYNFGAPQIVRGLAENKISNVTSSGFTLTVGPPRIFDTEPTNFSLVNAANVPIPVTSVAMNAMGASYDFQADLPAGTYFLRVNSAPNLSIPAISLPLVTQVAFDNLIQSPDTGDISFTVYLNPALDGLQTYHFQIQTSTGSVFNPDTVTTSDGGQSYQAMIHPLPAGSYILQAKSFYTDTLPFNSGAGTLLVIPAVVDASDLTVSNIRSTGFTIRFNQHAVTGLSPADIHITDSHGSLIPNVALTTSDNLTYQITAALAKGQDYTLALSKSFYSFAVSYPVHVNLDAAASVSDVTANGLVLHLNPPLPGLEASANLRVTDASGTQLFPAPLSSTDNGASYYLDFGSTNALGSGKTYTIAFDVPLYNISPISFLTPLVLTVSSASSTQLVAHFDNAVNGLTADNFTLTDEAGAAVAVSSAVSVDGGVNYTISASMPPGHIYWLTYKPSGVIRVYAPVRVVVSKTISATVTNPSMRGFTLAFSEPVRGLQAKDLTLMNKTTQTRMPFNSYSLSTSDQGKTYQVAYTLTFPDVYTVDLTRDNFGVAQERFRLDAPKDIVTPIPVSVHIGYSGNDTILLEVYPKFSTPDSGFLLTEDNIQLTDADGQPVSFSLHRTDANHYELDSAVTSSTHDTLTLTYPGYDFGGPLDIARNLHVDTIYANQTQKGFILYLTPAVPDLTSSDMTLTNEDGPVDIGAITTDDFGKSYTVSASLSSGKTYSVAFQKQDYELVPISGIALNENGVAVEAVSTKGFTVHLDTPIQFGTVDVRIFDAHGNSVQVQSVYSPDGGHSYQVGAALEADADYTIQVENLGVNSASNGNDFGADTRIRIQSIGFTFAGMDNHSGNRVILQLTPAVDNLNAGNFRITAPFGKVPAVSAETTDQGSTYIITANFFGGEPYTILPVKDGYDFGAAVPLTVPYNVITAIPKAGAKDVMVALNPAVPGLTADNFLLKDSNGGVLAACSAVTTDGGNTYTVTANFVGGQTYSIGVAKTDYDFGSAISEFIPDLIAASIDSASPSGLVVVFDSAVPGLGASNFSLTHTNGSAEDPVIRSVTTTDGGASYHIAADLAGGNTYALTVAAPGLVFSPDRLSFLVDMTETATVSHVASAGLNLQLDPPVPGLLATDLSLLDEQGQSVAISSIQTSDNGATFTVNAALTEGKRYSLAIRKAGYQFGMNTSFIVPIRATAAIDYVSDMGFTLHLSKAVATLGVSDLSLTDDNGGPAIAIASLTTDDGGATYRVGATLQLGSTYTLQLQKSGYELGAAATLSVQATITMNATSIEDTYFYVVFSRAVLLKTATIMVRDDSGHTTTFTRSGDTDAVNLINLPFHLERGKFYTVEIVDPNHPFSAPIDAVLPTVVSPQVSRPQSTGFTLTLGQGAIDLQLADISLLDASGQAMNHIALESGAVAGTYQISADLTQGRKYTLKLSKKGFDFGPDLTVFVPIAVDVVLSDLSTLGFTISMSPAVPNLQITLKSNGTAIPNSVTTTDQGLTYKVTTNLGVNTPLLLSLTNAGYDFGPQLTVNNVTAPPAVLNAVTSVDGGSVLVNFDKPLNVFSINTQFAVNYKGTWLHGVTALLSDTDAKQIKVMLDGHTHITGADTATVTYTGANTIKASNGTYLPAFGELTIDVASTASGYAASQKYGDPASVAVTLRDQYHLDAAAAAVIMNDAGFRVVDYISSFKSAYSLTTLLQVTQLFYSIGADGLTALTALGGTINQENLNSLIAAGYDPDEFIGALQRFNYSASDIAIALNRAGVSKLRITQVLYARLHASANMTVTALRASGFSMADCLTLLGTVYGASEADAVAALKAAHISAANAVPGIRAAYAGNAAAANVVRVLYQSGYAPKDIGQAVADQYGLSNAAALIQVLRSAGLDEAATYAAAGSAFAHPDVAVAMVQAKIAFANVMAAVKASGDTDGLRSIVAAYKQSGIELTELETAMQTNSYSAQDAVNAVLSAGYGMTEAAGILKNAYRLDLVSAYGIMAGLFRYGYLDRTLGAHDTTIFSTMVQAGYDPSAMADYYLKHVNGGDTYLVMREFKLAGTDTDQALRILHDLMKAAYTPLTVDDAFQIFSTDLGYFTSDEILSAVLYAFANETATKLDVPTVGAAFFKLKLRIDNFYMKASQLKNRMGMTMRQWVELEKSDKNVRGLGAIPPVSQILQDTSSLYSSSTVSLQDIVTVMSTSSSFTLPEIIGGLEQYNEDHGLGSHKVQGILQYLKNSGYAMQDIMEAIITKYGNGWIASFSKIGLTASDVAVYYHTHGYSNAQIVAILSPYSLNTIVSVLRTDLGMPSADAMTLLTDSGYSNNSIVRAIGYIYQEAEIDVAIKLMKQQGYGAPQVIGYLSARGIDRVADVPGYLVKAGYTRDEVFTAVLQRYNSASELPAAVNILQSIYGAGQVGMGAILAAASISNETDAMDYLVAHGYKLPDLVNMLKTVYGKTGGETAALITAQYAPSPFSLSNILAAVSAVYSETQLSTVQNMLAVSGVTTPEGAIEALYASDYTLSLIAQVLKNGFSLDAGAASDLLIKSGHFDAATIGLTVTQLYYANETAGYLAKVLQSAGRTDVYAAIHYLYDTYYKGDAAAQIATVLKVIFGKTNLEAITLLQNYTAYTNNQILDGVGQAYGTDPLFAYFNKQVQRGYSAYNISYELFQMDRLGTDSNNLIDMLLSLGFDSFSIMKQRLYYYDASDGIELGHQLSRLGFVDPVVVAKLLKENNAHMTNEIKVIIDAERTAFPEETLGSIASAIKNTGYFSAASVINGFVSVHDSGHIPFDDTLVGLLRPMGFNASQSVDILHRAGFDGGSAIEKLKNSGYNLVDFIAKVYVSSSEGTLAGVLKVQGYSAVDIAKAMWASGSFYYADIYYGLDHAGFSDLATLISAYYQSGVPAAWVVRDMYLYGIAQRKGWSLTDIAKEFLLVSSCSVVDLTGYLNLADNNDYSLTFKVITEAATREKEQFLNSLSSVEKLALQNYVPNIIAVSTLRSSGLDAHATTKALLKGGGETSYTTAAVILYLGGYDVTDIISALWDVYRDAIGQTIVFTMLGNQAGKEIANYKKYARLVQVVSKLIKYGLTH